MSAPPATNTERLDAVSEHLPPVIVRNVLAPYSYEMPTVAQCMQQLCVDFCLRLTGSEKAPTTDEAYARQPPVINAILDSKEGCIMAYCEQFRTTNAVPPLEFDETDSAAITRVSMVLFPAWLKQYWSAKFSDVVEVRQGLTRPVLVRRTDATNLLSPDGWSAVQQHLRSGYGLDAGMFFADCKDRLLYKVLAAADGVDEENEEVPSETSPDELLWTTFLWSLSPPPFSVSVWEMLNDCPSLRELHLQNADGTSRKRKREREQDDADEADEDQADEDEAGAEQADE